MFARFLAPLTRHLDDHQLDGRELAADCCLSGRRPPGHGGFLIVGAMMVLGPLAGILGGALGASIAAGRNSCPDRSIAAGLFVA